MSAFDRFGPWVTGIALCFGGVLLVRVPVFGDSAWMATAVGYGLAGLGLLRIALGVSTRSNGDS